MPPRIPSLFHAPAAAMPLVLWHDIAMRTGEMLVASVQVIGHRTGRMAAAGHSPSLRDRREFSRMGLEKIEAAGESLWAMGQHMTALNANLAMRAWQDMMRAGTSWMSVGASRTLPQLHVEMARMTKKGLKPIHARATANAKRLGNR